MNKNIIFFFALFLCLSIITSCMTNTEDLTQEEEDTPDDVSYSNNIQPIFNQSCGGSGCHTNGSSQNNVDLSSYSSVINSVGTNYGTNIVVPGTPDESPIVDKIESNPEIGSRMPLTGGYLTNSEINLIKKWIKEGAEDN